MSIWIWIAFVGAIVGLLLLDLLVFHRKAHEVSFREATMTSLVWVSLGLGFGVVVWVWMGPQAGGEYLAGYLIEKSLAVDNIFVFAMIFAAFAVPARYQHRVLFWGVLGALVFRAVFILAGAALLERFHWAIYFFGALLILTGIRMLRQRNEHVDLSRSRVLALFRRFVPTTDEFDGQRLFTRRNGVLMATPLLAVLVLVETSDIIFAIDSIPAIFAITDDPFLVFSSNAFAILGLRALYFMLAGMMSRFIYLKVGLATVLLFVGAKMLVADLWKVPIWVSLAAIVTIVGASIAASLWATNEKRRPEGMPLDPVDGTAGTEVSPRPADRVGSTDG